MNNVELLKIPAELREFIDIDDDTFHHAVVFIFLWGKLEHALFEGNANEETIRAYNNDIDIRDMQGDVDYFIDRYRGDDRLVILFNGRNIRGMRIVQNMIDHNEFRLNALLMIVWRLRCNLFHGEKFGYSLRGQKDNFIHANNIMKALLRRHLPNG